MLDLETRNKTALVTGSSSGLGYGLTHALLEQGYCVYGMSRSDTPSDLEKYAHRQASAESQASARYYHLSIDLSRLSEIESKLNQWPGRDKSFDVVFLNAGILGEIRDMIDSPLEDLQHVMDVNLWSNKVLIDFLFSQRRRIQCRTDMVIGISSGASVNGNRGWSGYSISKAALNMLIQLYASELPETHFISLAPGLIYSQMQDSIATADTEKFPALKRLIAARGTEDMPGPEKAGQKILTTIEKLKQYPSGSFLDIRKL